MNRPRLLLVIGAGLLLPTSAIADPAQDSRAARDAPVGHQMTPDEQRAWLSQNEPRVQAARHVSKEQEQSEIGFFGHVATEQDIYRFGATHVGMCERLRPQGHRGPSGCTREEIVQLRDSELATASEQAKRRKDADARRAAGCQYDAPMTAVAARQNPEARRIVVSASLCLQHLVRAQAEANIAKEKKYAKKYGALDLGEINSNKFEIEEADEKTVALRAELKDLGGPLTCSSPMVAELMSCTIPDQNDVIRYAFDFDACQCAGRGLPGMTAGPDTSAAR